MKAPEQQAILARGSAGSMEEAAAARQAQAAVLREALAGKEAHLAALSDRLAAAEEALLSAQQAQQQEADPAAGAAVPDAALVARWACLAAQRQELAARWQCLAEEQKQLGIMLQQAGRRGGERACMLLLLGEAWCLLQGALGKEAIRHVPGTGMQTFVHSLAPLPCPRPAPLPRAAAGGDSGFEPGVASVRDVSCAIVSHQVDIPCGSCCFQR